MNKETENKLKICCNDIFDEWYAEYIKRNPKEEVYYTETRKSVEDSIINGMRRIEFKEIIEIKYRYGEISLYVKVIFTYNDARHASFYDDLFYMLNGTNYTGKRKI